MLITEAANASEWDSFLSSQRFRPFLQSWTMGEVYRAVGQEPIRLKVESDGKLVGLCFAHVVPARRGRHLAIPYGPVLSDVNALEPLIESLKQIAREKNCSFIRMSPFWPETGPESDQLKKQSVASPLHLLGEFLWYLPLVKPDPWKENMTTMIPRNEEEIFGSLRSTARNLIRRATKEGVTIETSQNPVKDLEHFLKLHDETRARHGFTPYTNSFFRAQVEQFASKGQLTLYLARYQGEVIASSIHMHAFGETSYHHGASTHRFHKIPSSYLLQWTAIQDALKRGDHVYNFWGVAPVTIGEDGKVIMTTKKHPFSGVTTFKTGFGGDLLSLVHCRDIPITGSYRVTRAFEQIRKWKRGF